MFNVNYQPPFKMEQPVDNNIVNDRAIIERMLNIMKSPPQGGKIDGVDKNPLSSLALFVIDQMTKAYERHPGLFIDSSTGNINNDAVDKHVSMLVRFYASVNQKLIAHALTLFNALEKVGK